jgi:hypothetical protein
MVIHNSKELYREISSIFKNEEKRTGQGEKAKKFANRNVGATDLLLSRWENLLTIKDAK